MNRRRFLGAAGTAFALGLAGCSGDAGSGAPAQRTPTDAPPSTATDRPAGRSAASGSLTDPDLPLDDSDLRRGAPKDAIPAIVDPAFGPDWSGVDASLDDDDRVIGVAFDGEARAYPLPVLNWHEVVNDDFAGPLLVTYCPLCGSGVTAERRVDGQVTTFGVSGYLWNSDLVMYDELTESLWSQVLGTAVQGPQTGTALSLLPSTLTTWGEWRGEHPATRVLLPPPASDTVTGRSTRNYDSNPYVGYEDSTTIGIGPGGSGDGRLHPKAMVIGVATDAVARAYPLETVQGRGGVVNDRVGDLPVVVAAADGSLVAYDRRVEGTRLTFERDGDALVAGGSRWGVVSGRARDGTYEGARLRQANDRSPMFWFSWAEFFPETEIFGGS